MEHYEFDIDAFVEHIDLEQDDLEQMDLFDEEFTEDDVHETQKNDMLLFCSEQHTQEEMTYKFLEIFGD